MILQLIILINGIGTFWFIGSKSSTARIVGFSWGIIGQPFWFYETAKHHQWGFFVLSCFYFFAYVRGIKNNWALDVKAMENLKNKLES
jgi:hypothetical protein